MRMTVENEDEDLEWVCADKVTPSVKSMRMTVENEDENLEWVRSSLYGGRDSRRTK